MRYGYARAFLRRLNIFPIWSSNDDTSQPIQGNQRGELCVVQALPQASEVVRFGNSWVAKSTPGAWEIIGSFPKSNTSGEYEMLLWNGDSTKSYVIDTIGATVDTSEIISMYMSICCQVTKPISQPTTGSVITPRSTSGVAQYRGNGVIRSNPTIGVQSVPPLIQSDYYYHGSSVICANAANATFSIEMPAYGRYVVPPKCGFAMATLGIGQPAVTTASIYVIWHEVSIGVVT